MYIYPVQNTMYIYLHIQYTRYQLTNLNRSFCSLCHAFHFPANLTSVVLLKVSAHLDDIARPDGCKPAGPDGIPRPAVLVIKWWPKLWWPSLWAKWWPKWWPDVLTCSTVLRWLCASGRLCSLHEYTPTWVWRIAIRTRWRMAETKNGLRTNNNWGSQALLVKFV